MQKEIKLNSAHESRALLNVEAERVTGLTLQSTAEMLAVEEPLEIQILHTMAGERKVKSVSVTMRTPGNDFELAVGFLMSEGVVHKANDVERVAYVEFVPPAKRELSPTRTISPHCLSNNIVRIELAANVAVNMVNLERNFYTTSSCGICGKASLLALRTLCPPQRHNGFTIDARTLYSLPARMRQAQSVFDCTGGLHSAGLFSANGELLSLREDVGRHNAADKLLGREFLDGRIPLQDALMLLSGRASFELLQKAIMGGIPMVASVGAPSSLALQLAKEFDVTLVGFLRDDHFNVYHGFQRLTGLA